MREWTVLNWNIRGLNADDKCNAVRNKIEESGCAIYCIQETKKQSFDTMYIKKVAPKRFNKFAFAPSVGASGGILMGWNSSIFTGEVKHIMRNAIIVKFTSTHNDQSWTLVTIYAPCQGEEKQQFIQWLNDLQIPDNENWMLIGDFNLYRSVEDRNRDGGNINDIITFNDIISNLGLQEIPLKGRNYTWSNMQEDPLLEQLDWCFTSASWISQYPNTLLLPLSRPTSDHTPCMAQIGTKIPKAQVFRFENYWIDQPGFLELVQQVWNSEIHGTNSATTLSAKFKLLRRVLKRWGKSLAHLNNTIKESNLVLATLDALEENRPLFRQESNFRIILKRHILKLLQFKKEYWRKRYTVRWTKLGDESTGFFHAAATERYRINTITSIDLEDGRTITEHQEKASVLWEEYRDRMSQTCNPTMWYNLQDLIQQHDLQHLSHSVTKEEIDDIIKNMLGQWTFL